MIRVICIGKLKESYLINLVNDYTKRINKYHKLELLELKDSNVNDEKLSIIKHIKHNSCVISLDLSGCQINSIEFKNLIENNLVNAKDITFIVGGSEGLHKEILELSNKIISFSQLTFPHGLFRGIILEQVYRSFKIMNNEKYHK